MDESIKLTLYRCTVENILETLGPYVRDYLRRDGRSRDKLGLVADSDHDFISVEASNISTTNGPTQRITFATFIAVLWETIPPSAEDKLCIDFVACIPRGHAIYFGGQLNTNAVKEIVPAMPKIQELHLNCAGMLSDGFLQPDPDGPLANTKLFPSLRRLHLEYIVPYDDDWTPLLSYLTHQTSGGQVISFSLSGKHIHICKDVVRDIEGLVEEFTLNLTLEADCPFDSCSGDEEDEE
jgi:hypothetical protein